MAASDSVVSTASGGRFMPPEELAMQSLTKQLYKSRIFRGFYVERCYVEQIAAFRDVIVLQRSERELEKLLLSSASKLQQFYQRFVPNMWLGITKGSMGSYRHKAQPGQLETCIWTEISDLAFGEYWFSIRTLRFRDREMQIKLKMVRAVEPESPTITRRSLSLKRNNGNGLEAPVKTIESNQTESSESKTTDPNTIGLADFINVLQKWLEGIKLTIYDFMANDVNKGNIIGVIRFLGLLIFSILSGAVVGLRFFGVFVLRFLFELSRFTHTATPIFFKLVDFVNKIFGAFFILLTMIWKDLVVNRGGPKPPLEAANSRFKRITYEPSGITTPHRRSSRYANSPNFL